jgi:hypothetical protein
MPIFPSGPSTSTLVHVSELPTRPRVEDDAGGMIVKVTSGGSVSGSAPILDRHCGEVENRVNCAGRVNAGTRKAGKVTSRARVMPKTLLSDPQDCAQRRVASMMMSQAKSR